MPFGRQRSSFVAVKVATLVKMRLRAANQIQIDRTGQIWRMTINLE
jgi:hypothetical protein